MFACQPIAAAVQQQGGNFIFTCKPASHQTITEYLTGAELEEYRQSTVTRGKRTTTIYRWLSGVPMRATDDALIVNWFSIEILNGKGKRTYYNSFITDLPVTTGTVAELPPVRARWKIENEPSTCSRQRIQSGTQLRARQGNPRLGPGDTQPARLRVPYPAVCGVVWPCGRGQETATASRPSRPRRSTHPRSAGRTAWRAIRIGCVVASSVVRRYAAATTAAHHEFGLHLEIDIRDRQGGRERGIGERPELIAEAVYPPKNQQREAECDGGAGSAGFHPHAEPLIVRIDALLVLNDEVAHFLWRDR